MGIARHASDIWTGPSRLLQLPEPLASTTRIFLIQPKACTKEEMLAARNELHTIFTMLVTRDFKNSQQRQLLRRGQAILHSIVISVDTGKGFDCELRSKHSFVCAANRHRPDYDQCHATHQHDYGINHTQKKSLQCLKSKLKLAHESLGCDGDLKTVTVLNDSEIYGPGFTIMKEECVGQVGKCLGGTPWHKSGALDFHGCGIRIGGKNSLCSCKHLRSILWELFMHTQENEKRNPCLLFLYSLRILSIAIAHQT